MTRPRPESRGNFDPPTDNPLKCVWMLANVVPYKLCDREYECEGCLFDNGMQGHAGIPSHDEPSWVQAPLVEDSKLFARSHHGVVLIEADGLKLSEGLFYHPGHAWARVEEYARVRVGLDDFALRLVGRIYGLRLPPQGEKVTRGQVCCHFVCRAGEAGLISPVSGVVLERNDDLLQLPSMANLDPYGRGWMLLVEPENLVASLKTLFYGRKAEVWFVLEIEKLQREIRDLNLPEPSDVCGTLQDGGLLTSDLSRFLNEGQFERLTQEFLSPQICNPPA